MANRGYAVLQVNYRGSFGLGKTYMNAGNGEYAGKMHDDLIDGVKWAVERNVTTADKVCIFGGSYGGYSTLLGLTITPTVFACGISLVGISNLQTQVDSFPEYWKPMIDQFIVETGGDPRTKEGREILKKKSPITYTDKIQRPLLIVHGANDPRVKQAESDQIVKAMQDRDIPVTYMVYPDEGHGLSSPKNKASFFAAAENFLAKALGGRAELIRDEIEKSSVKIMAGSIT
jgi:dipeptidyl aminopeptidase/acylaminoacyl peptidase